MRNVTRCDLIDEALRDAIRWIEAIYGGEINVDLSTHVSELQVWNELVDARDECRTLRSQYASSAENAGS